ncbi:MAG: right-handed parallel beta-helix repeat-containing protein, partial [Candidatus Neomarinimicrobiota bacterium]
ASNISKENFEIKIKTDKAGKVYYVVLSDGATAPTSAEVKAGTGSSGASAVTSSNATLSAETEKSLSISTSISGNTSYDVYVVVEDNSSSPLLQSSPTLVEVATSANTLPLFASGSPSVSVASDGTSATLSITADVAGTAYYVLLANNAAEPSATDVKNGTGKAGGSTYTDGNVTITANTASTASFSSLTESTEYDAWIVVEDNSSNIQSSASKIDLNTDKTSPTITTPVASGVTTTTFDFSYKINESGTGYYVVLKKGGSAPTAAQIKNGQDFSGNTDSVVVASSVILQSSVENIVSVAGLSSETQYTLHLAAEDANANIATTSSGIDVTTVALPKKITIASSGATASGVASDYTTIQAGISIAKVARDTLVVSAGTYTENIDFGGKDIFIKSESGPQTTILKPANTGIPVVSFIGNETSSATLAGFTLSGGGTIRGSAIQLNNSSPTIENCIITNSGGEGAISFYYSTATLKNCLIYNNTGSNPLYFDVSTSSPEFINCTIANNTGYGAGYSAPALTIAPIFKNSILWGNSSGGATGRYTIENSIVEGGFPSGSSVLAADPLFVNPGNGDFKLSDYSPAIGTANSSTATVEDLIDSVRGSTPDMGAYENSRSAPLTDTDSPTVTYVREGISGNASYSGSSTQLSAHWNGSDAASGIRKYEYAIDNTVGANSGAILAWTSAGSDTSATITGLSLAEGYQYFISVRATDMLGNVSSIVTSDGVVIDLTAPSIGTVLHGSGSHLSWLGDTSSVTASWSGFSDGASGVKEYEVMIRDSTGKTNETDWVIVPDSVISHAFIGLNLDNNSQYILKARASDKVGNMSSVVESALFQVDNEKPLLSSVYECHQDSCDVEDLDWFALDGDSFRLAWVVTDNGSLSEHQLAIGTSKDTDDMMTRSIVLDPMASENGDSLSFLFGDYYEEGQIYYTNVQVKDKAGNLSGIVSSDGFQIDALPPSIGEVTEGDGEDLDISTSMTSIRVSWKGFDDVDSGIDHYLVSLGSEPGEDDIRSEIKVSNNESINITGLNLEHGETYYSSVIAVDLVGNESDRVVSDGFAVDEFPGPPSITSIFPGDDIFLSLISDEKLIYKFSEPVAQVAVEVSSSLGSVVNFEVNQNKDSIVVKLQSPLTSLDTININLVEMTDLSGRVSEDTLFIFYTEILADYNHDLTIDVADLAALASSWTSEDFSFELGPVSGKAPHFIPQPDGEYNLRDIMAYTRMWRWNRGSSNLLNFTRSIVGDGVDVSYVDNNLNIIVPESVMAGQLAFQASSNETFLTLPEEKSGEVILLSHSEPALKENQIDFAYLKGEGNRSFVLPVEHGRESSTINMSYVFYNSEGNISGEGIKSIDITPLPAEFVLDQNYPNPFNPTTRIEYGLPVNSDINLTIYDLLGQEVRTLISKDYRQAGYHNSIWDARDKRGQIVSAGVYIYRLTARGDDGKNFALTKKMILLK